MKTKRESANPVVRNKYTPQFKEQVLERADKEGIPKVAQVLKGKISNKRNYRVSNEKMPVLRKR
jgi:uncharacterized membrane protein YgcG